MQPSGSNQIAQMMLEGMQEIIGESDLQSFFHQDRGVETRGSLSFNDLCEFQSAVEAAFGSTSGRGILWRSGRATLKRLLPGFWKQLGMSNLQYRLLPTPVRIQAGLGALAAVLGEIYGEEIQTGDAGDVWTWKMKHCPLSSQRDEPGPVCDFSVGLLEEYLSWTTSGRFYVVEETECLGIGGGACCIRIQKKPLN